MSLRYNHFQGDKNMNEADDQNLKLVDTQAINDGINSMSDDIAREFAAWEAASDEALLNFEQDLTGLP